MQRQRRRVSAPSKSICSTIKEGKLQLLNDSSSSSSDVIITRSRRRLSAPLPESISRSANDDEGTMLLFEKKAASSSSSSSVFNTRSRRRLSAPSSSSSESMSNSINKCMSLLFEEKTASLSLSNSTSTVTTTGLLYNENSSSSSASFISAITLANNTTGDSSAGVVSSSSVLRRQQQQQRKLRRPISRIELFENSLTMGDLIDTDNDNDNNDSNHYNLLDDNNSEMTTSEEFTTTTTSTITSRTASMIDTNENNNNNVLIARSTTYDDCCDRNSEIDDDLDDEESTDDESNTSDDEETSSSSRSIDGNEKNLANDFCFFSLPTNNATSASASASPLLSLPHIDNSFNDSFVVTVEHVDEEQGQEKNDDIVDKRIHQGYRLKTKGLLHRVCLPTDRSMRSLHRDDLFRTKSKTNLLLSGGRRGSFSLSTKVTEVIVVNNNQNDGSFSNRRYACKELKDKFIAATRSTGTGTGTAGRRYNNNKKDALLCAELIQATIDLAYEARVLSSLVHSNIIQIYGWGNNSNSNSNSNNTTKNEINASADDYSSSKFFFLMDVIQETLEERIQRWKKQNCHTCWSNYPQEPPPLIVTTGSSSSSSSSNLINDHFAYHIRTIEKIQYCSELASALEYLHNKNIIYNNLNPNTIGFCFDSSSDSSSLLNNDKGGGGVLKLIDFASSSCCTINNQWYQNDTNKVTTATMAYQYMAPEMFLNNSYIDYKCDIYSFSMVCWKIFSHQTPFQSLTPQHYEEFVYLRGHRPIQNNPAHNSSEPPRLFQHLEEWAWRNNNTQSFSFPSSCRDHPHINDDEQDDSNPLDDITSTSASSISASTSATPTSTSTSTVAVAVAATVPEEVYNLLSKGWKSKPCSRIDWDEIQLQLIALRRLEELRLQKKLLPNNQ